MCASSFVLFPPAEPAIQYFIRFSTASTLAHRMKFLHEPLAKAGRRVVEELRHNGGVGGLISLDEKGHGVYLYLCK